MYKLENIKISEKPNIFIIGLKEKEVGVLSGKIFVDDKIMNIKYTVESTEKSINEKLEIFKGWKSTVLIENYNKIKSVLREQTQEYKEEIEPQREKVEVKKEESLTERIKKAKNNIYINPFFVESLNIKNISR